MAQGRRCGLPGTQGLPTEQGQARGRGAPLPPCPPSSPISPQHGVTNTHHREPGPLGPASSSRAVFAAPSCGVEPGAGVSVQNQGGTNRAWAWGHQQRLGAAPCRARGRGAQTGPGGCAGPTPSLLQVNARSREGTSFSYFGE